MGGTELPAIWRETVRSEWCDYNGHLNMAYYVLIFDHATDVFHDSLGIDKPYRLDSNCSTFAVEIHTTYLAEVLEGDEVSVSTQLLDHDEKRLHYFHRMYHAEKGFLSATNEIMTVHVDLGVRKVVPMSDGIRQKAADMFDVHGDLPAPDQQGHTISIQRK
ncbi:MAG: thioesterase family protein [Alphaproteobacteria bacterium]|jgi:acyl-CoA thioester hydrolase